METATISEKEKIPEGKTWPQYLAAILGSLTMLCTGTIISWTSPALPYLQQPPANLSDEQASWVGSMTPLGAVVGSMGAGYLADRWGRRLLLLALAAPYLLGWVLVIVSNSYVLLLYTGRFISGLSTGAATVALAIYNEEISEVRIRGRLGCLLDFMIAFGFTIFYMLQNCLDDFFLATALCTVPPVFFFLTFTWMPESPVFLLSKGREQEAVQALRFLRGGAGYDVEPEIRSMREFRNEGARYSVDGATRATKRAHLAECFLKAGRVSNTAKAMRISFGLAVAAQLTGIQPVNYNTVDIFARGRSSISAETANMIFSTGQSLAAFAALALIDKLGRRVILLSSGVGMLVSTAVLCAHFVLKSHDGYASNFGWVPCFAVTTFSSSNGFGLGPVPWFVMAEIAPTESKEWISSICVCISWICQFVTSKLYSVMMNQLGDVWTFAIFSIFTIFTVAFIAVAVPETNNKTRAQIQCELQGRGVFAVKTKDISAFSYIQSCRSRIRKMISRT